MAVLDMNSVMIDAVPSASRTAQAGGSAPALDSSAAPMAPASPVSNASVPRLSPPPNSRIVPQSIRTASFQSRANSRRDQSTGITNSSNAANTATGSFGSTSRSAAAKPPSGPAASDAIPGAIHSTTAVRNAASEARSPARNRPRRSRSARISPIAPPSRAIPRVYRNASTDHTTANPTSATGTPRVIHWKNVILRPRTSSIMPIAMRLGGVPTGVAMPPISQENAIIRSRPVA